ncbi:MAG: zeta toxin family protein [Campylobacteraceae bacterium]|jgi:UDP-N-acetylglucosamine kinase|nr:zeta toxin family protein [Campylobacteraceae bacterium]
MSNNKWSYSKEQLEEETVKAWNVLLKKFPSVIPNQSNPTAFFLGGQPGAGKSTSQKKIIKEYLNNNALAISIDDFRQYHPHFKEIYDTYGADSAVYTHRFASDIAKNIRQKCIEQKYNVVVEGTFKNYESTSKTIDEFNRGGYECNITVVACPEQLSYFSTKHRIEKDRLSGELIRAVPTDVHKEAIDALAENTQKLFENTKYNIFEIRSRDGNKLYSNKENITEKTPKGILDIEINRKLNKEEIDLVSQSGVKIVIQAIDLEIEKLTPIDKLDTLMKHLDETREFNLQHTADTILESSKIKGTFTAKIDEEKLKRVVNEALQGHFKLHQKTVSILESFVNQEKTVKSNIKTILGNDKDNEKSITKENITKKEIKRDKDKNNDNDMEI